MAEDFEISDRSPPEKIFEAFLKLKSHEDCVKFVKKNPESSARIIYYLTKELLGTEPIVLPDAGRDNKFLT